MLIATLIIFVLTVLGIVLTSIFIPNLKIGKVKLSLFWIISLIGAIIMLCIKSTTIEDIWKAFTSNDSVNPLKILVLFLSMTLLSVFLDNFGFFEFVANKFANKFSKNQHTLFFGLYLVISVLTVFTSNDIIILTFTPFICFFAKRCNIKPLPYLIMEFVAANTWSMCLIIGNPTNIYLASSFNIDFFTYFLKMIIPTLGASAISLGILFLLFRKDLNEKLNISKEKEIKLDKLAITIGLIHLISATILLAISSYINWPMWIIAGVFALSIVVFSVIYSLIKHKNHLYNVAKRLPWNLIPFVLSMFVIVLSLNNVGVVDYIKEFLLKFNLTFSYGLSGALTANLINNIPMSVLYSSLGAEASLKAIYASITASNIAAFITPIGALAGLMWMSLLKSYDVKLSFIQFVKYGLIIGVPTLLSSLTILEFIVR